MCTYRAFVFVLSHLLAMIIVVACGTKFALQTMARVCCCFIFGLASKFRAHHQFGCWRKILYLLFAVSNIHVYMFGLTIVCSCNAGFRADATTLVVCLTCFSGGSGQFMERCWRNKYNCCWLVAWENGIVIWTNSEHEARTQVGVQTWTSIYSSRWWFAPALIIVQHTLGWSSSSCDRATIDVVLFWATHRARVGAPSTIILRARHDAPARAPFVQSFGHVRRRPFRC